MKVKKNKARNDNGVNGVTSTAGSIEKKKKRNRPAKTTTESMTKSNVSDSMIAARPKPIKRAGSGSTPIVKKRKSNLNDEVNQDKSSNATRNHRTFTPAPTKRSRSTDKAGSTPKVKNKKSNLSDEVRNKLNTENTIFVGNLPTTVTKKEILKMFAKFGNILAVRLRCAVLTPKAKNRKAGIILKKLVENSTYTAFVKFSDSKEAEEAVAMNGSLVKDHHLRVNLATENVESIDKNKAIYLRNMPYSLTEDELWNYFASCGEVVSVRIMRSRENYESRGMGYVNFATNDAVELALKMDKTEIQGRPVSIYRCGEHLKNIKKEEKKSARHKVNKKKKEQSDNDFSGFKSEVKQKKKKMRHLSAEMRKKKKMMKILTEKKEKRPSKKTTE